MVAQAITCVFGQSVIGKISNSLEVLEFIWSGFLRYNGRCEKSYSNNSFHGLKFEIILIWVQHVFQVLMSANNQKLQYSYLHHTNQTEIFSGIKLNNGTGFLLQHKTESMFHILYVCVKMDWNGSWFTDIPDINLPAKKMIHWGISCQTSYYHW